MSLQININVSIWWNIFIRKGPTGLGRVQCLNMTMTHNRFMVVPYRLCYHGISRTGICLSLLIQWLCHQFPNKWCKNTIITRVQNFTIYLRQHILLPKVKFSILMLYTQSVIKKNYTQDGKLPVYCVLVSHYVHYHKQGNLLKCQEIWQETDLLWKKIQICIFSVHFIVPSKVESWASIEYN